MQHFRNVIFLCCEYNKTAVDHVRRSRKEKFGTLTKGINSTWRLVTWTFFALKKKILPKLSRKVTDNSRVICYTCRRSPKFCRRLLVLSGGLPFSRNMILLIKTFHIKNQMFRSMCNIAINKNKKEKNEIMIHKKPWWSNRGKRGKYISVSNEHSV